MPESGQLPSGPSDLGSLGTATLPGQIVISSADGDGIIPINELPDSPEVECGEQETIKRRFSMNWDEACTQQLFLKRGTILGPDSNGEYSRVQTCTKQRQSGGRAILTIISESLSTDTPPDVFEVNPVDLGINIIKYPRYFYAFEPTAAMDADYKNSELLNQSVIRALQNYFENTTAAYRDALTFQIWQSLTYTGTVVNGVAIPDDSFPAALEDGTGVTIDPIPGTDLAKRAALEIIQKYWRNEETPSVSGFEIVKTSYSFTPQYLNPGGYIEDPIYDATPQLPEEFWLTSNDDSIFDAMGRINPQNYSVTGKEGGDTSISWLRCADKVDQTQRTWIKIRSRWMGTPIGHWDEDLFNFLDAPWSGSTNTRPYASMSVPAINQDDVIKAAISTLVVI